MVRTIEDKLKIALENNEKYKEQIKLLKKKVRNLNHCIKMIQKHMKTDEKVENKCSCCGVDLKGWIYHKKGIIKICHFCYNGLEQLGEDE